MGGWFNFKATTAQRISVVLKVIVKSAFLRWLRPSPRQVRSLTGLLIL